MLASGHMANSLQKDFIRRNLYRRREQIEAAEPVTKQPKTKPVQANQPLPYEEGYFKPVGKNLKLNQSAMHSDADKTHLASQKLEDLADKSDIVLTKISTVFPFTFFVNDIIVDPYKVNIIFREFFFSEHIHSIMVKDILDVVVETSLFFATVKIVDQGYTENSVNVAYLHKGDALKLRKIIQGLVIAHRQAVDLSVLSSDHIKDKAEELGQIKTIDDSKANMQSR